METCGIVCAGCCRAQICHIEGRRHPIELYYTPQPEPDYLDGCLIAVLQLHLTEAPGDILCFLPGMRIVPLCVARIALLFLARGHDLILRAEIAYRSGGY